MLQVTFYTIRMYRLSLKSVFIVTTQAATRKVKVVSKWRSMSGIGSPFCSFYVQILFQSKATQGWEITPEKKKCSRSLGRNKSNAHLFAAMSQLWHFFSFSVVVLYDLTILLPRLPLRH